jgi:hypothetical protein
MRAPAISGIAKNWELALLHLTAQCVLCAQLERTAPPVKLRGSVPLQDLVPGAIIGCQCTNLQYVVRDDFAHTVNRVLTRADFQRRQPG